MGKIISLTTKIDFYEVGKRDIVLIEQHSAQGEGDRWYYDVHFKNGTIIRCFDFKQVVFGKSEKENIPSKEK